MYIISCILSITKMSKQELAEFVSITEDMIDEYLNGEEIPKKIKERFATIFSFPSFYFDIDTSKDEYFKRIMRETIKNEWEHNKPQKYKHNITDEEIIDCLINAHDLITHKKFDDEHILNNKDVKNFLNRLLKNGYIKNNIKEKHEDEEIIDDVMDLKNNENEFDNKNDIYNKLLDWRRVRSEKENMREFMIIGDKVLKNIINTPIKNKKDLLKVSGIGLATYGKYGDEIYEIVKDKYAHKDVEVLEM